VADTSDVRSAAELRQEFDGAFAEPPVVPRAGAQRFIAIRANGNRFAFQLGDVSSVHARHDVLPVPSPVESQRGVAVFGGALVAVHDLSVLMTGAPSATAEWIARMQDGIALTFDEFE
jgi:hypothetical protein